MNEVLGYFVFQNVGNGRLVSKYANWTIPSPLTECSKLTKKEPDHDDFEGDYCSAWVENPNDPSPTEQVGQATLVIRKKAKAEGIYTLDWTGEGTFHGEGMLFNRLLVGAYWNHDLHGPTRPLP
jgi:hypothetical protein